jgi:hypothetical protein
VLAGAYGSTFSIRLMRKDLDLILASAAASGVPLPLTGVVQQLLQVCISTGLGDLGFISSPMRLKRDAGQFMPDPSHRPPAGCVSGPACPLSRTLA